MPVMYIADTSRFPSMYCANVSVRPLLRSSLLQCFPMVPTLPQKWPFPWVSEPHLIHGSMGLPKSALKRHLDRFSHFCRAHKHDQQTDSSSRPQSLVITAMRWYSL